MTQSLPNRGKYFDTETKFWNWVRSNLRRVWSTHPTKIEFLQSKRYTKRIGNRPIYHIDCAICGEPTMLKSIEVNHKEKCGDIKDDGYLTRLLNVGFDDLEALCKPCHSIVTYSERQGISFEEAKIEKQVVAFGKLPAAKQKKVLGETTAKNKEERMNEYRKKIQSR